MPEVPEQMLEQRDTAIGRVIDVRPESAVSSQAEKRGSQQGEDQQHQDGRDEDVPGENRHPEHGHTRAAHAHDGGDHVDRAQNGAQAADGDTQDPQVGSSARGVHGVRERDVNRPAEVGRATGGDEPAQRDQCTEDEQPQRQRIESREGHVGCADLQWQHQVGESEDHRGRVEQQHRGAVHGEQLVVLLVGQELQAGHGQFSAHEQRHQAGQGEEREARDHIHNADQLVIGGRDDLVDQIALRPRARRIRARRL